MTPRVLAASADATSLITDIRIGAPLRAVLARRGGQLRLESYHYLSGADLSWAQVLVAQRPTARRHWQLMASMRARGGIVVLEIDDLLTDMAPHLLHFQSMQRSVHWVRRCLETADLVTVTTARLAQELDVAADRVRVVPNSAFSLGDLPLPTHDIAAPATLLVASSDRVAGGVLMPLLARLQRHHGERLRVVAVGHVGDDLEAAGVAFERHPVLPRPEFVRLARSLSNVVAAIPLDDSRFSACKSAIKWFDYAEAGVPTLASDVSPYREVMRHDVTGALVANDETSWTRALERAFADSAWRSRIAVAARTEVRARHGIERTQAAWDAALADAVTLSASRAGAAPGVLERWGRALSDTAGHVMVAARRLNRDRIARRRRAVR